MWKILGEQQVDYLFNFYFSIFTTPTQKSPKEGDAKEEANEEDAAVIPRLVEKGDKGTGHAVFGEKVAAKCVWNKIIKIKKNYI